MIVDHAAINAGFDFRRYAMRPALANPISMIDCDQLASANVGHWSLIRHLQEDFSFAKTLIQPCGLVCEAAAAL